MCVRACVCVCGVGLEALRTYGRIVPYSHAGRLAVDQIGL